MEEFKVNFLVLCGRDEGVSIYGTLGKRSDRPERVR